MNFRGISVRKGVQQGSPTADCARNGASLLHVICLPEFGGPGGHGPEGDGTGAHPLRLRDEGPDPGWGESAACILYFIETYSREGALLLRSSQCLDLVSVWMRPLFWTLA